MPNNLSSDQYFQQLNDLVNQQKQFTAVDQNDVFNNLASKVDFFRPQYEALNTANAQAYAAPGSVLSQFEQQYGNNQMQAPTGALLSSILGQAGNNFATANTMGDIIGVQGGRLQDLAGTAVNQYNGQRDALGQQINSVQGLYTMASQREEAARQQAAAAAQQRAIDLQNTYSRNQKGLRVGQFVDGKGVVIDFDANGNPIYGQVKPKASALPTPQNPALTPASIAAAKPTPMQNPQGVGLSQMLAGTPQGLPQVNLLKPLALPGASSKPTISLNTGGFGGTKQAGGYIGG